jgi:O-methyltransferase
MNRKSLTVQAYYPQQTQQLLEVINTWPEERQILLIGFGEDMKWLNRLLDKRVAGLLDWRNEFYGYDVGTHIVQTLASCQEMPVSMTGLIICPDTLSLVEDAIRAVLKNSHLCQLPILWNIPNAYDPCTQEPWASQIYEKARQRATSVNSKDRLFNLLQCVRETQNVPGQIVEFGSFAGGTASVIWETLQSLQDSRTLTLFDSFKGLPVHRLGVDGRWGGTFSNVSLAEIRTRFKDCTGVQIIDGNILDTVQQIEGPLSLVHIDVDTYETVATVTQKVWPQLSPGGILLYDDYGFFPNCLPLKIWVDDFFKDKASDCFRLFLPSNGYVIRRRD